MGFLDDTIELIELAATSGITSSEYMSAKSQYLITYEDLDQLKVLLPMRAFIDDGSSGFEYPDPDKILVPQIP